MVAEHETQRLVQQMGGGVVGADRGAAGMVDGELDGGAALEHAILDGDGMGEDIAELLLDIADGGEEARAADCAGIADLAGSAPVTVAHVAEALQLQRVLPG